MKKLLILALVAPFFTANTIGSPIKLEKLVDRLAQNVDCPPFSALTRHTLTDASKFEPGEVQILREYGFHDLRQQLLRCHNQTLEIQIYQMLDSPAAYGLFTVYREIDSRVPKGFPGLVEESDHQIAFVQSQFYVRIRWNNKSGGSRKAIEIARSFAQALPVNWTYPRLVDYLPQKNLVAGTEMYFMGHQALNVRMPLGPDDPFGLVHGAEGVLADYKFNHGSAKLLLMMYPTQQLARKYLNNGHKHLMQKNPAWKVFYKREGPLVVMVLDSTDPEIASSFLDQVSYVSSVSWDPKAEPLSVGHMMLSVFFYVGTVIGITLVAGLSFGVLRVLICWLFPGKVFNRQEAYEVIRLKLLPPR